ncbi:Fic family protein [Sphingobacteriales bacterium UPWRP_1]|nr:hypothetical protein BVG80_15830 [Sphingobacteriales bacterium TSM_CSM]PSJ75052.1 Fic family protein [Sphingobacteriales bacterium UPWRP_1]
MKLNDEIIALIETVSQLKAEIDALRPLPEEVEGRVMQKLRLEWNYHSNAIEGNTLTYGETVTFLMHGLTAKGKPLKDHLDIKGHNEAIDFLLELVKNQSTLTETDIRNLHRLILAELYKVDAQTPDGKKIRKTIKPGTYKTEPNHVLTTAGQIHYYATPEEVAPRMQHLLDWYRAATDKGELHPLVIAAKFHHEFTAIHPFDDGNGRMARLLMNLILLQYGYPPVVIRQDKNSRNQYYAVLSRADAGDLSPFVEYLANLLLHSLQLYLRAAKGESIEEPDDFEKELALFKKEIIGLEKLEQSRSLEIQESLYKETFSHLLNSIFTRLNDVADLFTYVQCYGVDNADNKFTDFWWKFEENGSKEPYYQYFPSKDDGTKMAVSENGTDTFRTVNFDEQYVRHVYENWLQYKLATTISENILSFGIYYEGFNRKTPKPFDVNLQFYIRLDLFMYEIFYGFSPQLGSVKIGALQPKITQYYKQNVSEEEIDRLTQTIGKDLLQFIKQQIKQLQ